MKPAERIQVPDSEPLRDALAAICDALRPEVAVECGTYLGLGSTRLLVELASDFGMERIYTLENSRSRWLQARENLAAFPQVECHWGLSVDRAEAAQFITDDALLRETGPEPDIFIDHLPDPVAGYLRELERAPDETITEMPPDRLLEALAPLFTGRRPLFCLDSAGGVGLLEYRTVRKLMGNRPHAIWADDVNHVKHYRTLLELRTDPAVSQLRVFWDDGWCVALLNCPREDWPTRPK